MENSKIIMILTISLIGIFNDFNSALADEPFDCEIKSSEKAVIAIQEKMPSLKYEIFENKNNNLEFLYSKATYFHQPSAWMVPFEIYDKIQRTSIKMFGIVGCKNGVEFSKKR